VLVDYPSDVIACNVRDIFNNN